jgi:hypothetical protein
MVEICHMFLDVKAAPTQQASSLTSLHSLQRTLLGFAFLNLFLVSLIGLLLRSFPFLSSFPLEYKNILHGHSHFAFGGWVMPALLALFLRSFPEIAAKVSCRHWRNISVLLLVSAYGMLLSFPAQGYKAVSITFSTLSIAAGYYITLVTWKALKAVELKTSHRFIKWGLAYSVLSAIGPFATGPLIAMGKQGSPLYFDAIYFYLHFQYNGFFSFFVLALLYKLLEQKGSAENGRKVFLLFNLACIPTYALSLLWNQPPAIFNGIGGAGALLQLVGFIYLLKDIQSIKWKKTWMNYLVLVSLVAFGVKIILQFFSSLPSVAALAYHQRNFVIAYLHLVLLGFISVFVFAQVFATMKHDRLFKQGVLFFFFSFISTELLLVANAFSLDIPYYAQLLFVFTCFFPISFLWMNVAVQKNLPSRIQFQ